MRLSIIRNNSIRYMILPEVVKGSFWIDGFDNNGNKRNIVLIEADNEKWKLISNKNAYYIKDKVMQPFVYLENNSFYEIKNEYDKDSFIVYTSSIVEKYNTYEINEYLDKGFSIGSKNKNLISYNLLDDVSFYIKRENNKIFIINNKSSKDIFVNDVKLYNKMQLRIGDVIFVYGLRLILDGNMSSSLNYSLCVNNLSIEGVKTELIPIGDIVPQYSNFNDSDSEVYSSIYNDNDYFYKKPRIVPSLKTLNIKVDEPPAKQENQESPFLLTIGPMITMSMTSLMMGYNTLSGITNGTTTLKDATPSLIVCGTMFASIFVWPLLTRFYEKIDSSRKERKRQKKYNKYIDKKIEEISNAKNEQIALLKQHYLTSEESSLIILNKNPLLWQRRIHDEDYLTVNLGTGNCPMLINIDYPEERFTLEEDKLKKMVERLGSEPKILENVPITYSFKKNYISGIYGFNNLHDYVKRLLIQIQAFHSYDDLKIIILTDEEHENEWNYLKLDPHLFSDDKSIRYFATNNDEYKEVCYYLNRIFEDRKSSNQEEFQQLYFIVTDSFKKIREIDLINNILNSKNYFGFSLFVIDRKMTNFPDQCTSFIDLTLINNDNQYGELKNNLDIRNTIKFMADLNSVIDYELCVSTMANIPIDIKNDKEGKLVEKIGFLEMYGIGKIEQFNSYLRWTNNNPTLNLSAPVGVGKNGELITIDLHEKYHGPHGLIAGMTGSGKSEFIITYILSMAINFNPYEVQFILIDYKGGGLAGAFQNNITGIKLPHLVGTITNLDANEINRSLASIESELKRRQALFNSAREISGEGTIDIYKYQKMFRQGVIKEPISHLFIICDEFAELKNQQPEFMDQLISTARIGRSLGVHLILATQKPSGVVDPQIWSNTRFRVCLKVQDTSDSNEVIKKPDAAFLKNTGRFYFQVGYDEVFTIGQAAYAGGAYFPSDEVRKDIDTSIDLINNIGYVVKKIETKSALNVQVKSNGEELSNIVKYLSGLAKEQNISCRQLWLPKIPNIIILDDLVSKYNYNKQEYILNPVVGEYDVPNNQEQKLLTVPMYKYGNTLIYGASGSGKENFISTLLYSSLELYSANEVNYYIVDFGSGSLNCFKDANIVGDIVNGGSEEQMENLFKMLFATINDRKILFSKYDGSYSGFIKNSPRKVPNIVVIINNFENYNENCQDYSEYLNKLTREGYKYGIYFIITVNTPNGVNYKLKQNFGLVYSLNQNSDDDYSFIIPGVRNNYPAKNFGRGLIKMDNIYEFQTAMVKEDNMFNYIKEKVESFNLKNTAKAKKIPVLPSKVDKSIIDLSLEKNDIVIGLDKNSLRPITFDFSKYNINLISTVDLFTINKFINPLINQIIERSNRNLLVINSDEFELDSENTKYYQYINGNFDNFIEKLSGYIDTIYSKYEESGFDKTIFDKFKPSYCMIIGMDNLLSKLSNDSKNLFVKIFEKTKDLDVFNFIIVDSIDKIRRIENENWFRASVNKSFGIWLGNGINDQYSLNINQKIADMRNDVPYNFCFVIKRGKIYYVKYIEEYNINNK